MRNAPERDAKPKHHRHPSGQGGMNRYERETAQRHFGDDVEMDAEGRVSADELAATMHG